MRLSTLSDGLDLLVPAARDVPDPEIRGLALDSRKVEPGFLFAALPGTRADGAAFARQAVLAGAVAVLGGPGLQELGLPVPLLLGSDPNALLAKVAARFFGAQPATVAAGK